MDNDLEMSPEKRLMTTAASSIMPVDIVPSAEPSFRAGQPVPAGSAQPYGPARRVRRCLLLEEELQPFAAADQAREGIPCRLIGNVKNELLAVERRSQALEGELTQTVELLRAREEWWKNGLLEVMESAGAERHHFEQLEQSAETEFRDRVNALEVSVNRSQLEVQVSQQSVQHQEQNLSSLKISRNKCKKVALNLRFVHKML